MKIVYMGTSEFAVPPLEKLLSNGYIIDKVVTQPDRRDDKMLMAYANDFYNRLLSSINAPDEAKLLKPIKVTGRGRASGEK